MNIDGHHHHAHDGEHHRDVQGGRERAAVFGASDGLVSNISLILGIAGADPAPEVVRLAGLAGLIAGAASMAAGEYVSMRAQAELFEREIQVERRAHQENPAGEIEELSQIYAARGIEPDTAREIAAGLMADPEVAVATHAREELGIDPEAVGDPIAAATWSFLAFSIGALVPLVPWLVGSGTAAVVASVVAGSLAALVVGALLGGFTGRSRWRTAARQWLFAAIPAAVTYSIGSVIGLGPS